MPPTLPPFDVDGGGIAFQASLDTLDRPAIPRHGTSAIVGGRVLAHFPGGGERLRPGQLRRHALPRQGPAHRVRRRGLGTNLGSISPPTTSSAIGGLFSLGGYSDGELRGQAEAGGSVGYHFRLRALPSGLGEGVYLGVLLDARNVWPSSGDISISDLRYGVTLLLGADTLIGPIFLGYGMAEEGRDRVYFTVGRTPDHGDQSIRLASFGHGPDRTQFQFGACPPMTALPPPLARGAHPAGRRRPAVLLARSLERLRLGRRRQPGGERPLPRALGGQPALVPHGLSRGPLPAADLAQLHARPRDLGGAAARLPPDEPAAARAERGPLRIPGPGADPGRGPRGARRQ